MEDVRIGLNYNKPDWYEYTALILNEQKDLILSFLNKADFTISDIQAKKREWKENEVPAIFIEELRKELKKRGTWEIITFHKAKDEKGNLRYTPFFITEESSGTKKYLEIIGQGLEVIQGNEVLFVDELDTGLHPVLAEHLIDTFHKTSEKAQLIFTTHNTHLLSSNLFKRDQFWITEMHPEENYTDLYSFAELKIMKDHNLEKGYIAGKYGGIPYPG